MAHGSIDVVEALTGSCNIFMYRLGERLGVDRLCNVFDMVGIGRGSGIGLREDEAGINPTPGWLHANKNAAVTAGTARNFAIGQGELAMTPVQVANLIATYATGRYRPASLLRTAQKAPEWKLPASADHLLAIRRGIYGVVNNPEGTAHKYARFEHERFALCGKTGSATAHPWPTAFRVNYVDESGNAATAFVPEAAKDQAIARFRREHPAPRFDADDVAVARRWPPHSPGEGENFSHAWFAGFLQPLDGHGAPDWSREPQFAFAVLVEFGGSGGQTSGPLAVRVANELLRTLEDSEL
jgi:cell division protein FtsI/penicillin-binding protein 2